MDLKALQSYLQGKGSPLTLSASDPQLPAELTAFLATSPNHELTLAPGAGGIALSGSTLTVSGASADVWPLEGLAATKLTLSAATLTVTEATPVAISLTGSGAMSLGGSTAAVTFASPSSEGGAWTIALDADVSGVTPQALIDLAFAWDLPFELPPELDVLTQSLVLAKQDFSVAFVPGGPRDALVSFAIDAPQAKLKLIDGVLELEGLTLQALLKPQSISLGVVGHLEVDGVAVDVGVGFSPGDVWTAFVAPPEGGSFPGIAALADWIAGTGHSQAGDVAAGFANVGFDPKLFDAAIARVALTVDVAALKLVSFEVDSLLTIAALPLDVSLTLPDLTVSGTLHEGAAVKVSTVLGALGLPTTDLPVDTEISVVNFSAQPSHSAYMAELHVDDVAKAGPFDLEEISVRVAYSGAEGFDGVFWAQMSVWDLGALDASAEYSSSGGWTWSVATAPGQTLDLGGIIAHLGTEFGLSADEIPEPIRKLEISQLLLSMATGTSTFAFSFVGDFALADVPIEIAPSIEIAPVEVGDPGKGWNHEFGGTLTVAFVELTLAFDEVNTGSTTFVASLSPGAEGGPASVDVAALVAEISPSLGAEIPAGIVVDLKSAKLASIESPGNPRTLAMALDLGASIPLADLPLIGDKLPPGETVAIEDLQIFYASAAVGAAQATQLNRHLPPAVQFPAAGLAAGPGISAVVSIAGDTETLSLGLATPPPAAEAAAPATSPVPIGGAPSNRAVGLPRSGSGSAPAAAPTAKWFDVQRKLGAVQFSRIGVLYEDGALFFAIDAALTVGPLTLSVDGLGVGSKLTEFSPEFTLTGAGVAYEAPPLSIGGALLRIVPPPEGTTFELDGTLVIEAERFGIAAVGSYAVLDSGDPSLFVFGQLSAPLGGPPAFFVTGLMAGFGVNRDLQIPSPDEVAGFPLLVLNEPPAPGQQAPAQTPAHVLDVIEGRQPASPGATPKAWIAPSPGSYWLAAGLTATHFKLAETRALLAVEFGKELTIALLGLSTMRLPQSEDSSSTYAYAELEIEAVVKPQEGYFGLTAILAPSSYVLVPACKLTGGFAFSVWFGDSPHAGQFVLTLGGYHPAFKAPDYFPSVPRLGFSWAVSSTVSISGGAYFALTPSAAMAGGGLEALFHDGDLRAWFTAHADVLISWRPFFFIAEIDVEIGVSYRLNLLVCHKTIEVSLGADVELWGPPTGGRVHVHLWCVSFTVHFGSDQSGAATEPLEWKEFASLLPAADAVVTLQPTGGLSKALESTTSSSGKTWVVRATGFSFTTESAIPASHLCLGEAPAGEPTSGTVVSAAAVDVKPMNLTGATAVHRLIVRYGTPTATPHELSEWSLEANPRNLPDALWGTPPVPFTQEPATPAAELVRERPVGFAVTPPPPQLGTTRGAFPLHEYAQELVATTTMPLEPGAAPTGGYLPAAAPDSVGDIASIAAAASPRSGLVTALGDLYAGGDDAMTSMGKQAPTLFSEAPMEEVAPA